MKMIMMKVVLVVVVSLSLSFFHESHAYDGTGLTSICNMERIPGGSPLWGNLGFILHQLAQNTAYTRSYHMKTQYGGANCPAFGEARCNPAISNRQCCSCLDFLSNAIWGVCSDAIGASLQLQDCSLRYEDHHF